MLELKNISKIFPGVKALDDVSLTFVPGEIHALMGENGAGKSTLMKVITGIYKPDLGHMFLDGKAADMNSFKDATEHEINMVSQEISVIPEASIGENIVLDRIGKYKRNGKIQWEDVYNTASEYLALVGLNLNPRQKIGNLTVAQKQLIQIAKAISSKAKYLLMDEPTSSLTSGEARNLIQLVRKLKADGVAVIFISHKIEEVMELCDKVSVLRDGKYIGTRDCKGLNRQELVKMMIGREEEMKDMGGLDIRDENVMEVKGFTTYGQFDHVDMVLKKGEILGLYGLVGAGRTELMRLVIGADEKDEGELLINGKSTQIHSIQESLEKYKMGYVSENRKEEGLILEASVADNISITIWTQILNRFRKINRKQESQIVDSMIDKMKIKTPTSQTLVKTLSGGNQQKVSIGKWLAAGCDILIIDEPTVGVDIGAKEYIHQLIWNLAKEEGKSVILISSEMPELIKLSRRILVFRDQEIAGEISGLNGKPVNYEEVSSKIGKYLA